MVGRIVCICTPLAHEGATCLILTDNVLYSRSGLLRVSRIVKGKRLVATITVESQNGHTVPLEGHARAFPGIQWEDTSGRDADLLRGRCFINQDQAHGC